MHVIQNIILRVILNHDQLETKLDHLFSTDDTHPNGLSAP